MSEVDPGIQEDIRIFRFQERMHIASADAVRELSNEEIERAFLIWELDRERANLRAGSNN